MGFVLAESSCLHRLGEHLGPWTVAAPSRGAATLALADRAWQEATRAQLLKQTERLAALLRRHGLAPGRGCALFQ
ncbi:MAG: hypothetical protein ACREU9_10080 [Gammaproteobacteria bacterium]